MLRVCALVATALAGAALASSAQAAESLRFSVSLKPEKLGQGTTVGFDFDIVPRTSVVPPPLTHVDLRYPGDLGIGLSGLGLATCEASTIAVRGPEGCPAEARMGYGTVLAEIPVGGEVLEERATLAVLRAPTERGHISLLFYAEGRTPVGDEVVFPGALLPASPPFGGRLRIDVPLVQSFTGGPYVSVTQIHATLGPQHLTYYHHVAGRLVAYNPQGILLPHRCPRGGFRFAVQLGFLDGSRAGASASVPCPTTRRARARGH